MIKTNILLIFAKHYLYKVTTKLFPLPLILTFVFFILLTLFSLNIPFFWDEVYYIGTAFTMYDSNFRSLIPELVHDRGNFPVYGFYMACWWKAFGKTLAVSHIAILPVLLGVVWEYYLLAKRIVPEKWIRVALLLLVLEPTFLTQSILMGHDVFLLYFFLLSARALFYNKKILYVFAFCLLALHNIKGIPIAFALGIFYFVYKKYSMHAKIIRSDFLIHLLPALLWILWMLHHHRETGWYLLTPVNDYGNGLHLDASLLKRIVLGIWQVIDFGRIFLWLFIIGIFILFGKKIFTPELKPLLLLIIVLSAVLLLFFSLLDINLCHRYFMPVFLLITLIAGALIAGFIKKKKFQYLVCAVLSVGLITGNFWLYGGGFSNGWDSSLKVLPYFNLKNEMDDYVRKEKINPNEIGTKFPLHHNIKYTHLSGENFHYTDMKNDSLKTYKYILLSDVSNTFTVHEKKELNLDWILIKELSCRQVYLRLFKNQKIE